MGALVHRKAGTAMAGTTAGTEMEQAWADAPDEIP